jgi:hypothetical protein
VEAMQKAGWSRLDVPREAVKTEASTAFVAAVTKIDKRSKAYRDQKANQ